MTPLNILLLEDNIYDSKKIVEVLKTDYTTFTYHNIESAKNGLIKTDFDIAIIDINLEKKTDGIQFAEYLMKKHVSIPFLFLTSMQSRKIFEEAKLTNPYSYLFKPFNKLELHYAIELAITKHHSQERVFNSNRNDALLSKEYLFIKEQNRIFKVNTSDIEYIVVDNIYSSIYTSSKKYLIRLPLKKIKELLHSNNFEQVHRKYLVNTNRVLEFNLAENTLYLQSNKLIPISDRYKRNLSNSLDILR